MEKAYKFRIYPNKVQEELIQKTFGCVRYVYNRALSERIEQYKQTGKSDRYYAQSKFLTQWKEELDWLREPDKCSLQNSLKNLDDAYNNFYKTHNGKPRFKSKKNNVKSYTTNSSSIHILDKYIKLPKLGCIRCKISKQVVGRILMVQIDKFKGILDVLPKE